MPFSINGKMKIKNRKRRKQGHAKEETYLRFWTSLQMNWASLTMEPSCNLPLWTNSFFCVASIPCWWCKPSERMSRYLSVALFCCDWHCFKSMTCNTECNSSNVKHIFTIAPCVRFTTITACVFNLGFFCAKFDAQEKVRNPNWFWSGNALQYINVLPVR